MKQTSSFSKNEKDKAQQFITRNYIVVVESTLTRLHELYDNNPNEDTLEKIKLLEKRYKTLKDSYV